MKHPRTAEGGQTMSGLSGSSQLTPGGRSTEMISDRRPYANGKVLVEGVGENLLPTAKRGDFGGRALR